VPGRIDQCHTRVLVLGGMLVLIARAQQSIPAADWKEYSYPNDRFAMSFPYAPNPHADKINAGMTIYTIRLTPDSAISVRSKPADNCRLELRIAVQKVFTEGGIPQPRTIMVAGQEGFEYDRKKGERWSYTRLWCGDRIAFVATLIWPVGEAKPAAALRILNSFRIVASNK
jgi:hypothetical protein